MLLGLNIRDIVLIDRLDLALRPGLCVLTGETGAGKSILLDALGLALGKRAESGLVRTGAQQATVSAEFSVGRKHPAHAILGEAGLAGDGEAIVLRRLVGSDGRSRAFVNDEPASVGLLRELGESLVEIQGQFEQRGLLDPANHRMILDAFAEHSVTPNALAKAWHDWREAGQREADAARLLAASRDEEHLLRHHLAELDSLAPQEDEEDRLAVRRTMLQNAERLAETLTEAIGEIDGNAGAQAALARAARRLERARAAARLDAGLATELKPLRLDKARFRTVVSPLAEPDWGEHGCERVHFEVSTNPGAGFGPLARIASGGELSRFMLALKLVLAGTSSVPTLIFDEVDSGIGGAVAAAVGERLQRLGTNLQVLVVTHSPQVAARGAYHLRVAKSLAARETVTRVEELDEDTRQEEIARMLSGRNITAEARAAAASLIAGGRA